jgi:hypothetical protein
MHYLGIVLIFLKTPNYALQRVFTIAPKMWFAPNILPLFEIYGSDESLDGTRQVDLGNIDKS